MKIKMKTTAAGPALAFKLGQVLKVGVDVDAATAQAFVAGGYAEAVGPETATAGPAENAALGSAGEKPTPPKVTPAARKLAKKEGVNLAAVDPGRDNVIDVPQVNAYLEKGGV